MAADEITVMAMVGSPNDNPSMRVMRSQTVTVPMSGDLEAYSIEALRLVDELCRQVREESLLQVRALMDRMKRLEAERAEGIKPR